MQTQKEKPPLSERMNGAMNILQLVSHVLAIPSVVLLHRDIGSRYMGPQVFLTILFILFAPVLWPGGDPRAVVYFLMLFVLMCFIARYEAMRRGTRGDPIHRYSVGYPFLLAWFPWLNPMSCKLAQLFILLDVGLMFLRLSPAVGGILICSVIGHLIMQVLIELATADRLGAMRDQQADQRDLYERFRGFRDK